MKQLSELRTEADEGCQWRGHRIKWGDETPHHRGLVQSGECEVCQAWVQLCESPAPNGIDIGGPAVALNCPADPKWL